MNKSDWFKCPASISNFPSAKGRDAALVLGIGIATACSAYWILENWPTRSLRRALSRFTQHDPWYRAPTQMNQPPPPPPSAPPLVDLDIKSDTQAPAVATAPANMLHFVNNTDHFSHIDQL